MPSQPLKKDERKKPSGEPGDPCVMVIFGASGDLTKRKLLPALYNLSRDGLLSKHFAVIGISRSEMTHEQYRARMADDLREFATAASVDDELWNWFAERLYYLPGDLNQAQTYQRLEKLLKEVDEKHGTERNYFYYLATSPQFFSPVVKQLGAAKLAEQQGGTWRRVIFEKPFGRDLASARQLNHEVSQVLEENQVYRIDHYLGKETVQNIMVLRFANGIFEPVWNRRYIDHVQITVSEDLGVEERGGYYEQSGALRDMVPNHIFQLISLTAMEPPISFGADAVRDEQAKVLRAIQPMSPEEVLRRTVRGQYGGGSIEGEDVPAYRDEAKVDRESTTETFVAMKVHIDNWRWADVPFYLRTGKRLPKRVTEIGIQFKRAPFILFRQTAIQELSPNRLSLRIQPDEGISLTFGAKVPGPVLKMGSVDMDFKYTDYFGSKPSTGYERLLYDCMLGDATLFQRPDMTEASWAVVEPILDVWKALPPRDFPNYAAGTWGPQAANELLGREGRSWKLCGESGC
jgi:glucose-6-phosphate 1-dehydrogenase